MLTYPKSTMHVRRMPMHLSSGHVTGAEEILPPPLISHQSDLGRQVDSRWALLQISSLFYVICYISFMLWSYPFHKGLGQPFRNCANILFCCSQQMCIFHVLCQFVQWASSSSDIAAMPLLSSAIEIVNIMCYINLFTFFCNISTSRLQFWCWYLDILVWTLCLILIYFFSISHC